MLPLTANLLHMGDHNVRESIDKLRHKLRLDKLPKPVRIAVVTCVGVVCLLAGIAMIILPGPAFVFIPLGLFLLASEFKWAEKWAQRAVDGVEHIKGRWKAWRKRRKRVRSQA
jgi:hypothetical protein